MAPAVSGGAGAEEEARWRGAKETRKERRGEERRGAAAKTEREEKRERERERERERRGEGSAAFSVFLVRWPRREGVRELSSYSSSSASWAVTSTSSIEDSPR